MDSTCGVTLPVGVSGNKWGVHPTCGGVGTRVGGATLALLVVERVGRLQQLQATAEDGRVEPWVALLGGAARRPRPARRHHAEQDGEGELSLQQHRQADTPTAFRRLEFVNLLTRCTEVSYIINPRSTEICEVLQGATYAVGASPSKCVTQSAVCYTSRGTHVGEDADEVFVHLRHDVNAVAARLKNLTHFHH